MQKSVLSAFRLVLVESMYAGNVGAVARVATNYQLEDVKIAEPKCKWNQGEAILYARSHSAATLTSFQEVPDLVTALVDVPFAVAFSRRTGESRQPNIDLRDLVSLSEKGRVALVFGSEESGLNGDHLLKCSHLCQLPTAPIMPSLNLSHAVAVVVSQIFSQIAEKTDTQDPSVPLLKESLVSPVSLDNFELLIQHFRSVMVTSGLTIAGNPDRMLDELRRIFMKTNLTNKETNVLHGLLSAMERTLLKQQNEA
jgi:TrmH family RNA methyltransferase